MPAGLSTAPAGLARWEDLSEVAGPDFFLRLGASSLHIPCLAAGAESDRCLSVWSRGPSPRLWCNPATLRAEAARRDRRARPRAGPGRDLAPERRPTRPRSPILKTLVAGGLPLWNSHYSQADHRAAHMTATSAGDTSPQYVLTRLAETRPTGAPGSRVGLDAALSV
jgi:hypothetical protein